MGKLKQRLASFITAAIFLGFLWVLFKKVIVVVWIRLEWWHLLLLLVLLFFFIDTMVSRGLGAKEPVARKKDRFDEMRDRALGTDESLDEMKKTASDDAAGETLEGIKRRLAERENPPM